MIQVPITMPQIPGKINVKAEFLQGDASFRHDDGIELYIVWSDRAKERGFKLFLCQSCLKPSTDKKTWHDTRCTFEQHQDLLYKKEVNYS